MPMRKDLRTSSDRADHGPTIARKACSCFFAAIRSAEFFLIVLFSAVGLWLAVFFTHYFPDFGGIAESLMTQ